jgi:hypothetical protein
MERLHIEHEASKKNRIALTIGIVALVAIMSGSILLAQRNDQNTAGQPPATTTQQPYSQPEHESTQEYHLHQNIKATKFWVGEGADSSNRNIHNRSSAWRENWAEEFGGLDDPNDRCNYLPCDFKPKENAFYVAVPYNDFDDKGKRKPSAKQIYWYNPNMPKNVSLIKNHWVKITLGDKVVYGQVEDAGPYGEDDTSYVFGDNKPKEKDAGIDLSPAAADYVGLEGVGTEDGSGNVSWQFVDEKDVPDGPWKVAITRTNVD